MYRSGNPNTEACLSRNLSSFLLPLNNTAVRCYHAPNTLSVLCFAARVVPVCICMYICNTAVHASDQQKEHFGYNSTCVKSIQDCSSIGVQGPV